MKYGTVSVVESQESKSFVHLNFSFMCFDQRYV